MIAAQRASGLSRKAIHKGIRESRAGAGGGRTPMTATDPERVAMLDEQTLGVRARRRGGSGQLRAVSLEWPRLSPRG